MGIQVFIKGLHELGTLVRWLQQLITVVVLGISAIKIPKNVVVREKKLKLMVI